LLSTRQAQVAQLLVQGKISKEISYELGISLPTCTEHIKRLYEKLGVSNRAECVSRLIELGVQAPRQAPPLRYAEGL
jgi:DNA-binding NarL/FixJ family response regulator